jgi:hypothetical protein
MEREKDMLMTDSDGARVRAAVDVALDMVEIARDGDWDLVGSLFDGYVSSMQSEDDRNQHAWLLVRVLASATSMAMSIVGQLYPPSLTDMRNGLSRVEVALRMVDAVRGGDPDLADTIYFECMSPASSADEKVELSRTLAYSMTATTAVITSSFGEAYPPALDQWRESMWGIAGRR